MRKLLMTAAMAALTLTACKEIQPSGSRTERAAGDVLDGDKNAAQLAYEETNIRMHAGMTEIPADPDVAFMQGMVPHHQGAVEMAEIVLEYGEDPETRALAQSVIDSQTKEIAQMQAWLKARGVEPAAPSPVDHSGMDH